MSGAGAAEALRSRPSIVDVGRAIWTGDGSTVPEGRPLVVMLVDGLGAALLDRFAPLLETLHGHWTEAGAPTAAACFPTTTATCLTALGLGLAPGEHGLVGYSFRSEETSRPCRPTRLTGQEIEGLLPRCGRRRRASLVIPARLADSAFTRAVFPGARTLGYSSRREAVAATIAAARERSTVVVYVPWLDYAAHRYGLESGQVGSALRAVETLYRGLRAELPSKAALVVTGDHGLVEVNRRIGLEEHVESDGVALVAGEGRALHLYARPGADAELAAACRSIPESTVLRKEEAIEHGVFGPRVNAQSAGRIGDVVVTFTQGGSCLTWAAAPPGAWSPAQHGGLSPEELFVPLIGF